MRKGISIGFAVAVVVAIVIFWGNQHAGAVSPSNFGLTEGNLISAHPYGDPDVFTVNNWGYKRLFLNEVIFGFYGHLGGFRKVKPISPGVRDAFITSNVYKYVGDSKTYCMEITGNDTGVLHWLDISGDQAVAQDPNFFKSVFIINGLEFAWYPKGYTYTSVGQCKSSVNYTPQYTWTPQYCPQLTPPSQSFCSGGQIVPNYNGSCVTGYSCINPTTTPSTCPAVSYPSCQAGYYARAQYLSNGCVGSYVCTSTQLTPTPTPTATPTAIPTATVMPTATPTATPSATPTASATPPVTGNANITIRIDPSYETAGVIITLPSGSANDGDESATLEIAQQPCSGTCAYTQAYPFTRYDGTNMATSLFDLSPNTTYAIRVTFIDPDGGSGTKQTTFTTKADFVLPSGSTVKTVGATGSDYTSIQAALSAAQPGWEIVVKPGTYGAVSVSGKVGTANAPIVVRAQDQNNRPIISGSGASDALKIDGSAYIYFSGLETTGGTQGMYLRASSHIVVQNSYIHDYGTSGNGILLSKSAQYPGGILLGDTFLIQDNVIANNSGNTRSDSKIGIRIDNNGGSNVVMRRNTIYHNYDNIKMCQDEDVSRDLPENIAHVLAVTGSTGAWTNHDREAYDNYLYDAGDDNMEIDGICVNGRVFRNKLGTAYAGFSATDVAPGPVFVIRNVLDGDQTESSIKLNTSGNSAIPERNVYFFNNTFIRNNPGTGIGNLLNLWYAKDGDHNVRIKNYLFTNNIFWSRQGAKATDSSSNAWPIEHPKFDYDSWYTTNPVFEWWNGSLQTFNGFGAFQAGTGQESHGIFGDPKLDSSGKPMSGSPVIDKGVVIPGITNTYHGSAPDIGAKEF